jgi:hypothetical protein
MSLELTPMMATSAFAVGYALGWAAMKATADTRTRRRRNATRRSWVDWLLGRDPSERQPL